MPYVDLRFTLCSGDLLFASGRYLLSRAIERFADSPWRHVEILVRLKSADRVLLLESIEDMGVRLLLRAAF